MKNKFKIIARHKWVAGAVITESIEREEGNIRRFTATIRGWRNWKIWEGSLPDYIIKHNGDAHALTESIKSHVISIRDRIDAGDESVFSQAI
jgi:hypothetical protein